MRSSTPPVSISRNRQRNVTRTKAQPQVHEMQGVDRGRVTNHDVPADFNEFYDRYYNYVARLIKSRGIVRDDVEDVTQTILLHFFRHNALDDFDAEAFFARTGRTIQFTSFLSGFVLTYLRHHLTMQSRRTARSVAMLIETPRDEEFWENSYGFTYEADFSGPEYVEFVSSIHQHLAEPQTRTSGTVDLTSLFEAMREQIAFTGTYSTAILAEQFGVPRTHIQEAVKRLRRELAPIREAL